MLIKSSRIILILLVIIVTAIYLPYYYWLTFSEQVYGTYINYSPVIEKFIMWKHNETHYFDTDGKTYTRDEADKLLPLTHYRLLAAKGILLDSIQGIKLDVEDIRLNYIFYRIMPLYINSPQIKLYPLLESAPERLKLEMPDEFFRITDRIDFISTKTNEINEEISELFNKELIAKGFSFPAKKYFGNPTTKKAFDEGYFILDNDDELFHLKRIKGKPFCKRITSTSNLMIKTFFLKEYNLKEFYGYLITEDNRFFLILYNDYKLQEIPIKDYKADEDIIRFQANLLYRSITVEKDSYKTVYVTNRDYELIDTYKDTWISRNEKLAGIISSYIFPFEISLNSYHSRYIDFFFSDYRISSIYLNILLILIVIFIFKRRQLNIYRNIFYFIIILFTGIYGFVGIIIIKNDRNY